MKTGPERDLIDRFLKRSRQTGRSLGVRDVVVRELPEARADTVDSRRAAEAAALLAGIGQSAYLVALDERGEAWSSKDMAGAIRSLADRGVADLALAIGGADGHGAELTARADRQVSFGKMTWPHQLARIMLSEQIYRSLTILSGHPYHRA